MYSVIIEPEAESDIQNAIDWYEEQRPGLGDDFELCLDAGLEIASRTPTAFRKIYKSARRVLLNRFPYFILYVVDAQDVIVMAVFHVRRDPKSWQGRVVS